MPIPVLLTVREVGIGGCERDLTKVAIGLDRTRFEPHVGCFRPEGLRAGELRAHGVPIVQFQVRSLLSPGVWKGARQLGAYVKKHGIRVMHAFDVPMDLFAVPASRLCGIPAVISSRLSFRELVPNPHRFLLRWTDKMAHRIVVNSRAVQNELIECEHVAPQRTVLSYNGVDLRIFHPEPRARKVFQDASVVIGAVCALRREKRLDLLLDAFARVRQAHTAARLLIVGSGPMLESLQAQARSLEIEPFCHFEPSKTEVAEWMRSMDVFVMASESESFPNALLEAMACGCCPIGSRVGGVPELISDGQSGLIFRSGDARDLADKIELVVDDPGLRCRLAHQAARSAATQFSIEAAVERLQNLYTELLNPTSASPAR